MNPQVARQFGLVLRRRRQTLKLSQERVAHHAQLSRNYYQLLERGLSSRENETPANPSFSVLIALSSALDTTVPELLSEIFPSRRDAEVAFRAE